VLHALGGRILGYTTGLIFGKDPDVSGDIGASIGTFGSATAGPFALSQLKQSPGVNPPQPVKDPKAYVEPAPKRVRMETPDPVAKAPTSAEPSDVPALGPIEHFPFRGGRQPLPKPDAPNKVYRIMSLDEAAKALRTGKLPPPIRGAEGERFVSLDSKYAALFREKDIADLKEAFGGQVESVEKSLKRIDARLAQLKAEPTPNQEAISKLTAKRENLLASHKEQGLANKAKAEPIIKEWHEAPGQQVVVEIELEAGALDDILARSVDHDVWGNYSKSDKDVYHWKLERGYGRNIGIPKWQLDKFNARIKPKGIRFYAYRDMKLLGETKPLLGNN
jgi:hypothetical protein